MVITRLKWLGNGADYKTIERECKLIIGCGKIIVDRRGAKE